MTEANGTDAMLAEIAELRKRLAALEARVKSVDDHVDQIDGHLGYTPREYMRKGRHRVRTDRLDWERIEELERDGYEVDADADAGADELDARPWVTLLQDARMDQIEAQVLAMSEEMGAAYMPTQDYVDSVARRAARDALNAEWDAREAARIAAGGEPSIYDLFAPAPAAAHRADGPGPVIAAAEARGDALHAGVEHADLPADAHPNAYFAPAPAAAHRADGPGPVIAAAEARGDALHAGVEHAAEADDLPADARPNMYFISRETPDGGAGGRGA